MKTYYFKRLGKDSIHAAIADLCDYYGQGLIITRINVPTLYRGQGIGSSLLKRILEDADKEDVTLYLEILSSGGLTTEELYKWYRRHGFKGQQHGVMVRRPLPTK